MDPQEIIRRRQLALQRLPISVYIVDLIAKAKQLIVDTFNSGKNVGVMRIPNKEGLQIPQGFDIDTNVPEIAEFKNYLDAAGITLYQTYFRIFSRVTQGHPERAINCCIEIQYNMQTNNLYVRSSRAFCSSDQGIFGKYALPVVQDDRWSTKWNTPAYEYFKFDRGDCSYNYQNIKYWGAIVQNDEKEFQNEINILN
jgi:hypothetical protein